MEQVYTRHSKRRAERYESSNLSLATHRKKGWEFKRYCRRAGTQLAFIRPNRSVQFRSLQLLIGYANGKSGHVESVVILWVRLPSRSLVVRNANLYAT